MRGILLLSVLVPVLAGCRDAMAPGEFSAVPAMSTSADATWAGIASMPDPRFAHAAAAGADGRIYVFSGFFTAVLTTAAVYDPAAEQWSPIAEPGAQVLAGAARGSDGRLYLVGGGDAGLQPLSTVRAYDPGLGTWTSVAGLGTARHTLAVTAGADGRIYAIGGNNPGISSSLAVAEVYDPAADAWTAIAPMNVARQGHAAATGPDGRIYVFGGLASSGATASGEVYDPAADSWSPIAPLSHYRYGLAAARGADGLIYVFGGFADGVRLSTVQAYDPGADSWTDIAPMTMGRYLPAAARGADGMLYVTGGNTPAGITASAEQFLTFSPNRAPVADAGADLTLECVAGFAEAGLDASRSSDPDGDPLSYTWLVNGTVVATESTAAMTFSCGTYSIVLRVTDDDGATHEDEVIVTVADSRPPVIAFNQFATELRPPNHEMRLVAHVSATDECDGVPAFDVSVSTNEAEDGPGAGATSPDWLVEPADGGFDVWVRAERLGSGDGRVYTIVANATDHAGNASTVTGRVTVGVTDPK